MSRSEARASADLCAAIGRNPGYIGEAYLHAFYRNEVELGCCDRTARSDIQV